MTTEFPLQNQRIMVTRSAEQADSLCDKLEALGAAVIRFPVIQFAPLPAPELDDALSQLDQYSWLLFTSGNAVRFLLDRVSSKQYSVFSNQLKIAAVGSATQRLLAENGISVDFVPEQFTGEQLVLGLGDVTGQRILLPRAKIGRQEIVERLRELGALVDDIPLYDTVTAVPTPEAVAELQKGFDVLTFTSPSSVRNFLKIIETKPDRSVQIAVIGPSTGEEAEKFGLTVDIMPDEYTIDGLVTAVVTAIQSYANARGVKTPR